MEEIGSLPLVSVIIPVYNAEETILRALQSLYAQEYEPLEILLVNDGSTDHTDAVCRAAQQDDKRIRYVSQANAGCADARNTALNLAKGDYYCFMDADDVMAPGALRGMIREIGQCDLLIGHFNFVVGTSQSDRGVLKDDAVYDEKQFMKALIRHPGTFYFSVLWNKLYRGEIIREHHLTFDKRLTWGEDFAFNMRYYSLISSVRIWPVPVYSYYKAPGGISIRVLVHVFSACRIKWLMYQDFKKLCIQKNMWNEHKWRIRMYIFNITFVD